MIDNSISTLFKFVIYQNDGGQVIKPELVKSLLTTLMPIKNDLEEANTLHCLFLE